MAPLLGRFLIFRKTGLCSAQVVEVRLFKSGLLSDPAPMDRRRWEPWPPRSGNSPNWQRSEAELRHRTRTHLSLDKDCPDARPFQPPTRGKVIAIPQAGGLHHRYERLAV